MVDALDGVEAPDEEEGAGRTGRGRGGGAGEAEGVGDEVEALGGGAEEDGVALVVGGEGEEGAGALEADPAEGGVEEAFFEGGGPGVGRVEAVGGEDGGEAQAAGGEEAPGGEGAAGAVGVDEVRGKAAEGVGEREEGAEALDRDIVPAGGAGGAGEDADIVAGGAQFAGEVAHVLFEASAAGEEATGDQGYPHGCPEGEG